MLKSPFKSIHFDWLANPDQGEVDSSEQPLVDFPFEPIPFPAELGKITHSQHILALGMAINSVRSEFTSAAAGHAIPGTIAKVDFAEPTFQATTFRGLRVAYHEKYPECKLALSEGIDLFRHTQRYTTEVIADGTFGGVCIILSAGQSVLDHLIGESGASQLLEQLDLANSPAITARQIPLHISQHLVASHTSNLHGYLLKLHMQARVLEYLVSLMRHLSAQAEVVLPPNHSQMRQRVQAIHDQILACEGKLPTLDKLALQYGRSAKLLNDEFALEYGQSIYAFLVDYRLKQAHAALEHTQVPIKQLAARLGYAHVSNFTIAFKKHFGYPPGYLRKNGLP
jgi:AraC-like DNA-binding protein